MRPILALLALLGPLPTHLGSGDDVQPRDTVSTVESVVPVLPDGVRVDVVGGDSFLRVRSTGHEVEVAGYENEPYIRIRPNGDVFEDQGTTTWQLSQNRFGTPNGAPGSTADSDTTGAATTIGSWVPIGHNGSAMWHDHRIHWMARTTPTVIDDKGTVQHWKVTVTVDGKPHTVNGTLYLRDKATFAWWLLALPAAALAWFLAVRRRARWHSWLCWVSALVTWTGFMQWRDMPPGARITPLLMFFGIASLVACNIAMAVANRQPANPRNEWMASSLAAGGGACLLTVMFMTWAQVRAAYVPMWGPDWIARAIVPLMVGTAVVAVADGVMRVLRVEPATDAVTD